MEWFSLDWYAFLRFCGALAILLLVYYLLFDQKARYRHCRIYLLASVGIALFSSVIRIPVYSTGAQQCVEKWIYAKERTEHFSVPVQIPEATPEYFAISPLAEAGQPSFVSERTITDMSSGENERVGKSWNMAYVFWSVYWLVTLFLMLRCGFAVVKILRLKKWGSCSRKDDLTIVRNNKVMSPFSFFRTIYIDRKLTGMTLDVILAHEKSHIEHRHYWDTFLIELFSIVFWFNPCVWLIKRELRALHEFEVDCSLLADGIGLSEYQTIIFSGLMGYCPAVANGFHNSLIKKRFIMMKKGNIIRYALLRKALLLPAVAIVMVLFAFTVKESEPVKDVSLSNEFVQPFPAADLQEASLSGQEEEMPSVVAIKQDSVIPVVTGQVNESAIIIVENQISEKEAVVNVEAVPIAANKVVVDEQGKEVDSVKNSVFNEKQLVESIIPFQNRTILRYIEPLDGETRVTVAVPVRKGRGCIKFNKGYCLVDKKTNDVYRIRSVARGIPLNKVFCVEKPMNQMLEFTMIFPPLKSKVKEVSFFDVFPEESGQILDGSAPWVWRDVVIAAYLPPKERAKYYHPDGSRTFERKLAHQTLTADQIVEIPGGFIYKTVIDRIETDKNETRVTLAVPVMSDHNWTLFNKGLCIVDSRNGDEYKIRSLTRGMNLNTALWIDGKKQRMVRFTMVFPPLKPRAKFIDLYTKYPEEAVPAPDAGERWEWRNVKVADYVFPKGNIVY